MMHFDIDGEATVLETLDEIVLPERPRAVERNHMKVSDQVAQLLHCSGARQGPAADVIVEIELVFVDPHWVIDAERCHLRSAPIGGEQVEPRHRVVAELLKGNVRWVARRSENRHAADVHRCLGRFQIEEAGVQRREPLHDAFPLAPLARAPAEALPSL